MILIVDSDNDSDLKIKKSFEGLGFQSIVVARSAGQAKSILMPENEKNNITLIIINSELKDENGYSLCRYIRKTEGMEKTYIILLISSNENRSAIEKSRHSGANDYAVKPYDSAGFVQRFSAYIQSRTVLLIEDDPIVRQIVTSILLNYKAEVIELDDGVQAHNLINSMPSVCLVLVDIGLPGMNGVQLVTGIRSKQNWRKTSIVMLTGSKEPSDVKGSLSAGANDYIVKPFNIDDFKKRMSRYLDAD
ncbi:hypothetical protein MNBD_GAMMA09-1017 [hydrothermal vent metagenome]|uniref:Response regulatory domain-containing protein n=1 Tax=hydrothermal vent metagenome TaxID=652676 RepID=A0A3B0XNI6_9ZZZZ